MTITEIQNKLINDEIDYGEAFELIKKIPKHWHTKSWTDKRNKIIKTECEQCGQKNGPMVAQHLTHPIKFSIIRNEIFNSLLHDSLKRTILPTPVIIESEIVKFKNENSKIRNACPFCKRLTFRQRKTMTPEYFCEKCKKYFHEPTQIEYTELFKSVTNIDHIKNYLLFKKSKEILSDFRNSLFVKYEKQIGKEALLIAMKMSIKYYDMDNVFTFCKKCASNMDLNHNLLCWNCKTNYFNYEMYDCCYECYEKETIAENPFQNLIWKYREEDNNYS